MGNMYRTMLFVPGNSPEKLIKSEVYRADCIIYDLEDSVSIEEKDSARILVSNFLKEHRPDCRIGVRINPDDSPFFEEDLKMMVPLVPDFIRLPKSETAYQIQRLDKLITNYEKEYGITIGTIKIVATIESALGVYNAYQIASASSRMLGIGLGAEDYRVDMGIKKEDDGSEVLFPRNLIALAAHAAKIIPIDYVYSDTKDKDKFKQDTVLGKKCGYRSRSVIHPNQIAIVHECYKFSDEDIQYAQEIISAYSQAMEKGEGVTSVNGKMVDLPVVENAKRILEMSKIDFRS